MLYVSDSESEDAPGKDTNNPGCKRGIRGGSVKDGKVQFYIPPPPVSDPKLPPPEGVAADSHGSDTNREPEDPSGETCGHVAEIMDAEVKPAESDRQDQQCRANDDGDLRGSMSG